MQKTIENGVTVLTVDEGMKLTNDSTYASVVRLGKEDSPENWHEITDEEAERLQREKEEETISENR